MPVNRKDRELTMHTPNVVYHGAADGDLTLTPDQTVAMVTPPSSGSTTVFLPNVFEAAGRIYTIISNGNAVGTVDVAGDGSELDAFTSSANLTDDGDRIACYSDGIQWYQIGSVLT